MISATQQYIYFFSTILSLRRYVSTDCGPQPTLNQVCDGDCFPGTKLLERGSNRSPPSRAKIEGWNYTSTSHIFTA
jgi:hypothetical protein